MKKLRLRIIGEGTTDSPYRPELVLGTTHKEGDICIHPIPLTKRGKLKSDTCEVTILEKGVDFGA